MCGYCYQIFAGWDGLDINSIENPMDELQAQPLSMFKQGPGDQMSRML